MTYYHAVMLDECGQEFGAGVEADNREDARTELRERYPENRGIVQLEDENDVQPDYTFDLDEVEYE
jgi:hypothetical protein